MERLKIKVKYFDKDIDEVTFIDGKKSNWIDLRAADTITLMAGDYTRIPLGVGMKLPDGYEALIAPRGSTFEKYGIIQTNSPGVVDNSYSGNNDQWFMPVYATRDVTINKNERICQFRILPIMDRETKIETVESLDDVDRGGFGSTGRV